MSEKPGPNEFRVMYRNEGEAWDRCWTHRSTLHEAEAAARKIRRKVALPRREAWIESRTVTEWARVADPEPPE